MIKALFDLKMEYHLNSIFPLYQELAKDKNYDIRIRVGKDPEKILGLFLISKKEKIVSYLKKQGYELTNNTKGFDVVISCDALKKPEKYGDIIRITLDHGVGIKTSRIRNIVKQPDFSYHVFLEGQYWFDYIKSLGWKNKADFHITGLPKLDPLFWKGFYNNKKLNSKLGFDPDKRTVLFAPSYKPSCIDFIKEKIIDLIPKYNLIIKLHPYSWSGRYAPHSHHRFYEKLAEKNKQLYLIPKDEYDIYPYLYFADTLISDTSSVINEFLALGKFGIIYVLPHFKRKHSDGMDVLSIDPKEWLKGAFPHMFKPADLIPAVESALNPTSKMKKKLEEYRSYFFYGLDGNSSRRVKEKIDELIK